MSGMFATVMFNFEVKNLNSRGEQLQIGKWRMGFPEHKAVDDLCIA